MSGEIKRMTEKQKLRIFRLCDVGDGNEGIGWPHRNGYFLQLRFENGDFAKTGSEWWFPECRTDKRFDLMGQATFERGLEDNLVEAGCTIFRASKENLGTTIEDKKYKAVGAGIDHLEALLDAAEKVLK